MPRVKNRSDNQVLRELLPILIRKGVGISLREISDVVGLSKATLVQRFGSKDNIVREAMLLSNQEMQEHLEIVCKRASGLPPSIDVIVETMIEFAKFVDAPSRVAEGLEILKLDIVDPTFNELSKDHFRIRKKFYLSQLRRLSDNGVIKIANPEMVAHLLDRVWQGTIMLWAVDAERPLDEELRENLRFFLAGELS